MIHPAASAKKDIREVFALVQKEFGDSVTLHETNGAYIVVSPKAIEHVCHFLRRDPALAFDALMCIGGVDGEVTLPTEQRDVFVVVYVAYSYKYRHEVCLHVRLTKENPKVPTVEGVWPAANWFEREAYDLFGIVFEGHSDLRRLLLPPDWVGYPLRKNYEYPKEYNGISCVRPKLK